MASLGVMTYNCRQEMLVNDNNVPGGVHAIAVVAAVTAVQAVAIAQGATLDIVVLTECRTHTANAVQLACILLIPLGFGVGTTNGVVGTLGQRRLGIIVFVRAGSVFAGAVQVNINAMHNNLNLDEGTIAAVTTNVGSFAVVCLPVPSNARYAVRVAQDALLLAVVQRLVNTHGPFLFVAGHFNSPRAVNDVAAGVLFQGAQYGAARTRFTNLLAANGLDDTTRVTAGNGTVLWTDRTTHLGGVSRMRTDGIFLSLANTHTRHAEVMVAPAFLQAAGNLPRFGCASLPVFARFVLAAPVIAPAAPVVVVAAAVAPILVAAHAGAHEHAPAAKKAKTGDGSSAEDPVVL